MKNKLLSVIVPAYNAEQYIERCIQSILNSTYKDLEAIVVDDGSKDVTVNVVRDMQEKDKRIRLISKKTAELEVRETKLRGGVYCIC